MPPQAKPETRDLNRSKEARIHASCTDSLPLSDVPDLSLPPKKYRSLGLHASLPSRAVVGIDGDNRPARREQLPPPGEPQPRPAVAVPQEDTPARGGADLRGVNLRGADLWFADLREADLRGADLTEATLVSARLTGAKLQGAKLEGATLAEADLWFADLREADLRGADLTEA
ncbi:MAG: pentapeptide repeat-containing protein, partial [candidate division NC10 bacterium]|nr:pentapeptide repeat-containing protein [candidate division NC10 bacterium]